MSLPEGIKGMLDNQLRTVLMSKGLSRREVEIVEMAAKGWPSKVIGNAAFITEKTVKFHLTSIYKKLGVKSRSEMIVWCAPHLDFK